MTTVTVVKTYENGKSIQQSPVQLLIVCVCVCVILHSCGTQHSTEHF